MKTRSLLIAFVLFSAGVFAQTRGGGAVNPRGSYSAPSSGGYSSSPSSGGSSGSISRSGNYGGYSSTPSTPSRTESSGSSGASSMPSRSNTSGSSSGTYSTSPTYTNGTNNGTYYNTNGYPPSSTEINGIGSTSYPQDNNWTRGTNDEQVRNSAKQDIRNTLSTLDKSRQSYTVSGTQPSQVVGLGGTIMNINPEDLETVDGQPISGDIEVNLKELDGPAKMGLAGTPTMSNGEMLVSGGSYFFGMQNNGKEVRLKDGKSMEVQLPLLENTEPGMELFLGQVDASGNVNWQPTGKPLTNIGSVPTTPANENPGGNSGTEGNTNGSGYTGPGRPENGTSTLPTKGGNSNGNAGNNTNTSAGNRPANNYYSPINITSMGYVNADKFFRGGVKMNVEVENADPAATQVFVVFKNKRSLVEGEPERGFVSNNFLFNSIPKNEDVKIVAISKKTRGQTYVGEVYTNTKEKKQFVTLKPVTDDEVSKVFEYNQ